MLLTNGKSHRRDRFYTLHIAAASKYLRPRNHRRLLQEVRRGYYRERTKARTKKRACCLFAWIRREIKVRAAARQPNHEGRTTIVGVGERGERGGRWSWHPQMRKIVLLTSFARNLLIFRKVDKRKVWLDKRREKKTAWMLWKFASGRATFINLRAARWRRGVEKVARKTSDILARRLERVSSAWAVSRNLFLRERERCLVHGL